MASLTPAQRQIADAMIAGTFDKLDTQGRIQPAETVDQMYAGIYGPKTAAKPTYQAGMMGRGQPASTGMDRLPQGTAGLPNPSPGSGLTPQQLAAMGGWTMNNTGTLGYVQPSANPAVAAATQVAQGVPLPRPRPGYAPTTIDLAAMGADPGMGGAMIGNGVMAPGIAPQGPPPPGIAPTRWAGDQPARVSAPTIMRAASPNGYTYGKGADGQWNQQGKTPWAASLSPSDQYAVANAAAAQAAKIKQSQATGSTGVYNYKNGVRGSTVNGMSSADAYAAANEAAKVNAKAKAGKSTSSNSWFNSVTGA